MLLGPYVQFALCNVAYDFPGIARKGEKKQKGDAKGFFRPLVVIVNAKLSVRLINHFAVNFLQVCND
jgi:hypothetical protein